MNGLIRVKAGFFLLCSPEGCKGWDGFKRDAEDGMGSRGIQREGWVQAVQEK